MSFLGGLFGGGGDPDSDLQQIPQYYKQYLGPYANAGIGYEKFLGPMLQHLMTNPNALEDQIMSHYQESPYAKYQTGQVTDQMNRAAALGGNLGSPNEQAAMAPRVQGVVSADQQNYLHNALAPYQMGLSGLQGLTQLGANAGGQIANMYGDLYSNEANMDAAQNSQGQNLLGGLLGIAGGVAGGPLGSALGGGLSHLFGGSSGAPASATAPSPGLNPYFQSLMPGLLAQQAY